MGQTVHCPACETPHHRDCWDYNDGCSTYACGGQTAPVVRATDVHPPVTREGSTLGWLTGTADDRQELRDLCAAVLGVFVLGLFRAAPPLLYPVAVALALVAVYLAAPWRRLSTLRIRGAEGLDRSLPSTATDAESRALERKAVGALVGAGVPHQLANAYALFEQRHPREPLQGGLQAEAALELLDAGYGALGLEALDKVLRLQGTRRDPVHHARWLEVLRAEPALAMLGPRDPDGAWPAPLAEASAGLAPLRESMPGLARAGSVYIVSLHAAGVPFPARDLLAQTPREAGHLPLAGPFVAGPYAFTPGLTLAERLWDLGHPVLPLPADDLVLPPPAREVESISFTSREARWKTAEGPVVAPWDQVRTIHYGLVRTIEETEALEVDDWGPGGSEDVCPRTYHRTRIRQSVELRPVLEFLLGGGSVRLRAFRDVPDLFRYLGRRRGPVSAFNFRTAAKDAIRFAPRARFGHGVVALLTEQVLPGSRHEDLEDLDAYVAWFEVLDSPPLRAVWPWRSRAVGGA